MVLQRDFYLREDVVLVAHELLGKYLFCRTSEGTCGGIILETEAYAGETDRASHAFGGRRTRRTEVMYRQGGTAYVYFCYGMHSLFNVVTNRAGIPHAVLVRGILPAVGTDLMFARSKSAGTLNRSGTGPGRLTRLLGIDYHDTGLDLTNGDCIEGAGHTNPCGSPEKQIWIEDRGIRISSQMVVTGKRVGVDYAGEDASLPYRFYLKDLEFNGMR